MDKETQELFGMIDENQKKIISQQAIKEQEKLKIDKYNSVKNKKSKGIGNLKKIKKAVILTLSIGTVVIISSKIIKLEEPSVTSKISNEVVTQENIVEEIKENKFDNKTHTKELIEHNEKIIDTATQKEELNDNETTKEETDTDSFTKKTNSNENEEFIKGEAFDQDKGYNKGFNFFYSTNYNEYLEKYSKMYGVDYNLMLAIFMQESVGGLDTNSASAVGIGQIERTDRSGSDMVYNYETGKVEEINYNNIDMDEQNVKVACQIMQYSANKYGPNICAMLTNYNQGPTTTTKIVNEIARQKGCTTDDLKYDTTISDWSGYIRLCTSYGDPNYIQNVLSFCGNEKFSFYVEGEKYLVDINTGEYTKLETNDDIYEISHKSK